MNSEFLGRFIMGIIITSYLYSGLPNKNQHMCSTSSSCSHVSCNAKPPVGVDGGGSKRIVWTFSVWQINEVFGTKVYMVVKILNNKWGQQKLRTGFSLFKYVEFKCYILIKSQAFENYCSQTDLRSKQLFGTTSFELLYLSFRDILYIQFNNLKCNAIVVENMMKHRDG